MHRRLLFPLALASTFLLAACGTTDPAADETSPGESSSDAPQSEAPSDAGPITVTDAFGQDITLEEPAERVVSLEWGQTENLVALGVEPVGAADVAGYNTWDTVAPLDEDTTDVGTRTEPSIEAIAALEPDLILGVELSVPEDARAQLEEIAPVVLQTSADATRPLDHVREQFEETAQLVGAEEQAAQVLADFDQQLEAARTAMDEAGASGRPFVMSYIYTEGNTFSLRMHGSGSAPVAVAEEIGYTNAWEEPGDEVWGLSDADLEALTGLADETVFTYWINSTSDDPTDALADNQLWATLPFVEAGNAHPVADGTWIYGGPLSLGALAEELATFVQ